MATSVAGVEVAAAETLSQLGDVVMENGTAAPVTPARLMDWLAGLEPPLCPIKVRLVGLGASVGLPDTTRVTGIMSGELVALGLVMLMVAV